jgi:Flp pilus assembly protein TadG
MHAATEDEAQALVEFALMVPLIFLLIVNAVNFGGFLYAWITIANATRAGANYGALGAISAGSLTSATSAQITSLITADTSSLRSAPSVCVNQNATASATSGSCSFSISSIPPDPEGPPYVSLAVDVRYTYSPFIPLFRFPGLGIYATLPPTVIQRRTLMRMLN